MKTAINIVLLVILFSTRVLAQNPFLPPTAFIPDGEPHVFEYNGEERLFIYGSRDENVTAYCGCGHDVWSAPVTDLTKWTNHGEIFNVKQVWDIGYGIVDGQSFGAPDCVYNPITKKFYLYTFFLEYYKMDGKQGPLKDSPKSIFGFCDDGPLCVMAQSDSPIGPFINPVICDWPPASEGGTFDPAVLVDEQKDGSVKVYAYWGKKNGDRWAEIDSRDMHSIIKPKTGRPFIDRKNKRTALEATYKTLNNPALNGYSSLFEASSIRKIAKDKYVFIYSPNERFSTLVYCYGNTPEGPWTYGGIIVDNAQNWDFGNNHGSIVKVNGQWYVVYHKALGNSYNRQAMIEPVDVRIEGDKIVIPQVEMTSQGIHSDGLNAFSRYNINTICYKTNGVRVAGYERNPDGLNPLVGLNTNNSVVGIKYLNFESKPIKDKDRLNLKLNVSMISNDASITVQVVPKADFDDESKRVTLATFKLSDFMTADGAYHDITFPIKGLDKNKALNSIGGLKGQLGLLLIFNGSKNNSEICRIKGYEFAKGKIAPPNPLRQVRIQPEITNGSVSALPVKARSGESVKLTVKPDFGYELQNITVKGVGGKSITANQNTAAPYAPLSFNFEMPDQDVMISAKFTKINN